MAVRFGVAGNSDSFYAEGYKGTEQAFKWVSEKGLTAFEYSFGRGVNCGDVKAQAIRLEAEKYGVQLSAHAPYYINLCTDDAEKIQASFAYINESIATCFKMGGKRIVVHVGSASKMDRVEALKLARKNLETYGKAFTEKNKNADMLIALETMGKINQFGTLEEIVELCKISSLFIPCIDFGHLNSRSNGGIKNISDYKKVFDYIATELGENVLNKLHMHFSKILYTGSGEVKHLNFADDTENKYGPCYQPLMKLFKQYKMTNAVLISESKGMQAEDAVEMLSYYRKLK